VDALGDIVELVKSDTMDTGSEISGSQLCENHRRIIACLPS
jgi:hypothetical protein